MNGYEKRVESKKKQIKKCALELLDRYEIERITIFQIAENAKVSRATIYKHFGDKENLYTEIFNEIITDSIKNIEMVMDGDGNFYEKYKRIQELKASVFKLSESAFTNINMDRHGEFIGYISFEQSTRIRELTDQLLNQGRDEGAISKQISNESIHDLIKILRSGMTMLTVKKDPMINDMERLMMVNKLFLNAIKDNNN